MKQYPHKCIKPACGQSYTDEDPDAYYCPPCQEANKAIAAKVDSQHQGAPKEQPLSDLQIHDAEAITIKGMKFVKTTL